MDNSLKISIITPSFNQGEFIEECILSVLNQKYSNFEHIIFDSLSTDNTIDILKKYPHLIWFSQKDKGQSDALNKALDLATGDVIGCLNTDDYYLPNTFKIVVDKFNEFPKKNWLAGNLLFRIEEINKLKYWPSVNLTYKTLKNNCDVLRTQSTFIKKSIFNDVGYFNTNLHMVMDYEMWLRIAKKYEPLNIKDNLSVFRIHENQKTTQKNIIKQYRELIIIMLKEKAFIALLRKTINVFISIIKIYIKKFLIYYNIININSYSSIFNKKNIIDLTNVNNKRRN
jgi:glycosyltransferase involved in cell wall biosynthesis